MRHTLITLLFLAATIALAQPPSDIPILVDSQVGTVRSLEIYQGETRSFVATFLAGGATVDVSSANAYMWWATSPNADRYIPASAELVTDGTDGRVRFTFLGQHVATAGDFVYGIGAGATFRQGAFRVTPNPLSPWPATTNFIMSTNLAGVTFVNQPWVETITLHGGNSNAAARLGTGVTITVNTNDATARVEAGNNVTITETNDGNAMIYTVSATGGGGSGDSTSRLFAVAGSGRVTVTNGYGSTAVIGVDVTGLATGTPLYAESDTAALSALSSATTSLFAAQSSEASARSAADGALSNSVGVLNAATGSYYRASNPSNFVSFSALTNEIGARAFPAASGVSVSNTANTAVGWGNHATNLYIKPTSLGPLSNAVSQINTSTVPALQSAQAASSNALRVAISNEAYLRIEADAATSNVLLALTAATGSYYKASNPSNFMSGTQVSTAIVAATTGKFDRVAGIAVSNLAAQAYGWGDHSVAGYASQSEFTAWATNFEFSSTSYVPRVGSSTIVRDGTNDLTLSLGGEVMLISAPSYIGSGLYMHDFFAGYLSNNETGVRSDSKLRLRGNEGVMISAGEGEYVYIDNDKLLLDRAPPLYGFATRYISSALVTSTLVRLAIDGSGDLQTITFEGTRTFGYTNAASRWLFSGVAWTNLQGQPNAGGLAYTNNGSMATMFNQSTGIITHLEYLIQSNSTPYGWFSVEVNGNPIGINLLANGALNRVQIPSPVYNGDTLALRFTTPPPVGGETAVELKFLAAFGPQNPDVVGRIHDLYAQSVMVDDPTTQRGTSNKRYTDTGDAATLAAARAEVWNRTQGTDLQATPFRWSPRYTTQGENNNLVTRYGGGIAEAIYGQSATIIPEIKHFSVNAGDVVTMSVWAWSDMMTNLAPEVSTDLMTWTRLSPTNIISSQMLDWFTAQIVFANSDTNALFVRLVDTTGGSGTILKRLLGTYEAYNLRATERVYVGSLTNSYLYRSGTNLMYRASDGREVVIGTEDLSPLVARWSSYPATNRVTIDASSTTSGYPHAIGSFNPSHRIDMLSYSQGSGTISTGALVYAPSDPTHRLWLIDGNGTNAVLTEASINPVNIMTVGAFNSQKLSLFRNSGFAFPSTSTDPGLPGMMFVTNGYLVTFDAQSNRWGRVQLDYGW